MVLAISGEPGGDGGLDPPHPGLTKILESSAPMVQFVIFIKNIELHRKRVYWHKNVNKLSQRELWSYEYSSIMNTIFGPYYT